MIWWCVIKIVRILKYEWKHRQKKTIRDRLIMLTFSIIVIWFNFIFLKESYNDKEYLFLLLMVFIQLCVYLCIHFTCKDKIASKDLLYSKYCKNTFLYTYRRPRKTLVHLGIWTTRVVVTNLYNILLLEADEVCALIKSARDEFDIEGVTFLGGEPLLQAKGLSKVAQYCQENELSVVCFTGFDYSTKMDLPYTEQLLNCVDVLIYGPYINALNCTKRNWVGSSNQRFLYLSDRYDASIETMKIPSIEIHLKQDTIVINGDPNTLN